MRHERLIDRSVPLEQAGWASRDTVRVTEYWTVKERERTLALLQRAPEAQPTIEDITGREEEARPFVVKDEAIQVVTVEKARDMLVTRVYYLGDLVQGVGPFGGALQWGPFLDFQQTTANVDLIVKSIESSIDPLSWKDRGGPCTITFHYPSMSIIVRASAEVHATLGAKIGGGR